MDSPPSAGKGEEGADLLGKDPFAFHPVLKGRVIQIAAANCADPVDHFSFFFRIVLCHPMGK